MADKIKKPSKKEMQDQVVAAVAKCNGVLQQLAMNSNTVFTTIDTTVIEFDGKRVPQYKVMFRDIPAKDAK